MYCTICDPKMKYTECICNDHIRQFEEIHKSIKFTEFSNFKLVKTWSISTMTMCAKFNSPINIENYKACYETKESKNKFYNCLNIYLTVKYQNKSRISLKLFTNGNIQLAGATNVHSATYAIRKIFKRLININCFNTSNPFISDIRICMINSDFKIDKNIKQPFMCSLIDQLKIQTDMNILRYSFNPSKYPGINIKFVHNVNEQTTCSVFRPGSIMITGGNNLKNYREILFKICNFLENNNEILY